MQPASRDANDEAAKLNQRAFHVDRRVLAKVTPTAAWFPHIARPDQGVVAVASPDVRKRILGAAKALVAASRETIETRGIGGTTLTTTRRPRPINQPRSP